MECYAHFSFYYQLRLTLSFVSVKPVELQSESKLIKKYTFVNLRIKSINVAGIRHISLCDDRKFWIWYVYLVFIYCKYDKYERNTLCLLFIKPCLPFSKIALVPVICSFQCLISLKN